jgi:hypothetical protein
MIKGKYNSLDEVKKMFKHQRSPNTCWHVNYWNIFNEFFTREFGFHLGKKPISEKDIKNSIQGRGPYGQYPLKRYVEGINSKLKGTPIILQERINAPSLLPVNIPDPSQKVDINTLVAICENSDYSFPVISVCGDWFEFVNMRGWADKDNSHVIIVMECNLDEDKIYFFDPAEKFCSQPNQKGVFPSFINTDKLIRYWNIDWSGPRWTSWFQKKDMSLEGWVEE